MPRQHTTLDELILSLDEARPIEAFISTSQRQRKLEKRPPSTIHNHLSISFTWQRTRNTSISREIVTNSDGQAARNPYESPAEQGAGLKRLGQRQVLRQETRVWQRLGLAGEFKIGAALCERDVVRVCEGRWACLALSGTSCITIQAARAVEAEMRASVAFEGADRAVNAALSLCPSCFRRQRYAIPARSTQTCLSPWARD
eukprot:CAMPEP_0173104568 /NCGR_PEP_ID=MMETSP1102-20130122/39371_1 /TAXON_ID=49646 /ORGANISM="Geminigera sp., Strain Caron Lab Isolate" /LENGTH=200 /DNA_ID=CAMNT_0014000215 /DNA_START=3137 /DNA_END=3740 /DNA_ORIENTATION=+